VWLALVAAAAPVVWATPPVALHSDGVGAFRLGALLVGAAQQVARIDRAALQIGPGCDEREQSVVSVAVAGLPATVMAMADAQGRIGEVVASVPHQGAAVDWPACQAQAQRWVRALAPRLGNGHTEPAAPRGAATLATTRFSPQAWLETRWFTGGRSCDLSLHFVRASAQAPMR
jgi:hypothetical protein